MSNNLDVMTRSSLKNKLILVALIGVSVFPLSYTAQAQTSNQPQLNSITPAPAQIGQRITIQGAGFSNFNTITYVGNSLSASSVGTSLQGTSINTTVPSTLASGTYQVTVLPAGQSPTNSLALVIVGLLPSPTISPTPGPSDEVTITSIAPTQAQPGQRATIRGTGFGNYNEIGLSSDFFSTTAVASSLTGQEINFTIPFNIGSGLYRVTVNTRGQTSNAVPLLVIGAAPTPSPPPTPTITPTPTVSPTPSPIPRDIILTSISPNPALVGQRVTITGSGFASHNAVRLAKGDMVVSTSATSIFGTSITFTVPSLSGGTYRVSVAAGGHVSNALSLAILRPVVLLTPIPAPFFLP